MNTSMLPLLAGARSLAVSALALAVTVVGLVLAGLFAALPVTEQRS